jgi:protein-tyrosine phosphatase
VTLPGPIAPAPAGAFRKVARERTNILVLCTANRCRSVMAGALLARGLGAARIAAAVDSAGLRQEGVPPAPEAVSVMAAYGIDVTWHRSRLLTAADLATAELVLAMTRAHVRHAVVLDPAAWPRTFTLKELVWRAEQPGPRRRGEPLTDWLGRVSRGRGRTALLGDSPRDDLADPIGGPLSAYEMTAAQLAQLADRLIELGWAGGG